MLGKRPSAPEPAISPEAYVANVDLPEGLGLDQDALKGYKDFMHSELKLPADVGSKLIEKYMASESQRFEAQQAAMVESREKGMATLQGEWGDTTQANIDQTVNFMNQTFPQEVVQQISAAGLANSPEFIKTIHEISKSFQEDQSGGESTGQGFSYGSPGDAITALKADKVKMKALMNPSDPEHAAVKKEWKELHSKLS
jgi:hypothetical protein